ncbi:MAG: DNA-formamidopyrimidine glycosylase [Chloroflexota bacterium]
MPELPEVETVVRNLRQPLIGRTVKSMWYDWARTIQQPSPELFSARIQGQTFRAVNRRAKYILAELDHDILVVHLKMTGRLYVTGSTEIHNADRWVHFRLDLDNDKQLRFSDARKFGRVYLVNSLDEVNDKIGPEPLESTFTLETFQAQLHGRQHVIKTLLLDQTFVAGIGNIYADEALFRAQIHPLRRSNRLSEAEIYRLHQTIQDALNAGIDHEGASVNWYRKPDGTKGTSQDHFFVYGRNGEPCRRCGHTIEKIRVGQRGTHFCPNCQSANP